MKIEDLRQNFPEMPADLRQMVENEVHRQIRKIGRAHV